PAAAAAQGRCAEPRPGRRDRRPGHHHERRRSPLGGGQEAAEPGGQGMSTELLAALTVFVLAIMSGFAVISKVPATLHTPLMSGANSIHGIVLVGSMFIAASATDLLSQILSFVAVAFATMNVVGGYVVTDRMLQ